MQNTSNAVKETPRPAHNMRKQQANHKTCCSHGQALWWVDYYSFEERILNIWFIPIKIQKKKERKGNNLRWSTFSLSLDCTKWFFNIKMSAFVAFVQFGRSALAMTSQGHTHGVIRGLELLNCFLLRSGVRRILPGFRVTGFHWSEFDQCFISHHIQSLLSHRRVFFSLKLIKI